MYFVGAFVHRRTNAFFTWSVNIFVHGDKESDRSFGEHAHIFAG